MKKSATRATRSNPVAVVTGAGRRLGRQIALALGGHGFDIVVHYHQSEKGARRVVREIRALGSHAIAVKADISRADHIKRLAAQTIDEFGRVDLLVNSAAVFIDATWDATTEQLWDGTLGINLRGTFFCCQEFGRLMLKRKRGTIINMASLGGLQAWTKHLPYSVSKAGVIMLTKIMAKSLAPHIRVNAIAPGAIIIKGEEDPSVRHMPVKKIPLRSYGTPADITDAVLYLATSARYTTGEILTVDGGRFIQ
jgi:pteridine reductase